MTIVIMYYSFSLTPPSPCASIDCTNKELIMQQRKLSRKEELELEVTGKYCNAINKSRVLQEGDNGQLYVIDFKARKLVEKKELDSTKKAC